MRGCVIALALAIPAWIVIGLVAYAIAKLAGLVS
jgi:hypothetical protein